METISNKVNTRVKDYVFVLQTDYVLFLSLDNKD